METKQKIYVFQTESVLTRGGEKYLYEILKRLNKKHKIILFLQKVSPYWKNVYKKQKIEIRLLWQPIHFYWMLLPFTLFINWLNLKKEVKENDVVFATNFPLSFLAILLSKKTICHCFEPLAIFYDQIVIKNHPYFSRLCIKVAKFLYSGLDKFAIKQCQILTTLNKEVKEHIIKLYKRKPDFYLKNAVDVDFFKTNDNKKQKSKIIIGHSTDYTVFKGTENFLEIAKLLVEKFPDLQIKITESMIYKDVKLKYIKFVKKNKLEKNIHFIGNLSEKEMVSFYQSINAFCYTGSPLCAGGSTASLSVLEAESCGTVVFRSIGNKSEIKNGKTGFYIDPHQHKKAFDIISNYIYFSKKKKQEMSQNASKYIRENFSWNSTSQKLENIIQLIK